MIRVSNVSYPQLATTSANCTRGRDGAAQRVLFKPIQLSPCSSWISVFRKKYCFLLPPSSFLINPSFLLHCLPNPEFSLKFSGKMKEIQGNPLSLKSLNHISLLCGSVEQSIDFYQNVLGFFPIRRPGSFNFDGAW